MPHWHKGATQKPSPTSAHFREDLEELPRSISKWAGAGRQRLQHLSPKINPAARRLHPCRKIRHWGSTSTGGKWLESPSAQIWVPSCIFLDHSRLKRSPGTAPSRQFCIQPPSPADKVWKKRAFLCQLAPRPGIHRVPGCTLVY